MSKFYDQSLVFNNDKECQKTSDNLVVRKAAKSISNISESPTGSFENLNRPPLKHSASVFSRDASEGSSFSSLFPNMRRSFDVTSAAQDNAPRPLKTMKLFDIVIKALSDLNQKYSKYKHSIDGPEQPGGGSICDKVDQRILILEALRADYESLIQDKEEIVKEIEEWLATIPSSTTAAASMESDSMDCDRYNTVCREMRIVESKLEKCCGKLQFQIIELDAVSRVSPLDQYELSITPNDGTKFKTRIKVERNGHQIWDMTTFSMQPTIDDTFDLKFQELKTLNKATVLVNRKVPFISNLIMSDPNIYSCWLTSVGTIKLKMIVQWNAVLDYPDLNMVFNQIDLKHYDAAAKEGIMLRKRGISDFHLTTNVRSSLTFSSIFRFDGFDRSSTNGSMGNIVENSEEDTINDINIRNIQNSRSSDKTKATYSDDLEDIVMRKRSISEKVDIKAKLSCTDGAGDHVSIASSKIVPDSGTTHDQDVASHEDKVQCGGAYERITSVTERKAPRDRALTMNIKEDGTQCHEDLANAESIFDNEGTKDRNIIDEEETLSRDSSDNIAISDGGGDVIGVQCTEIHGQSFGPGITHPFGEQSDLAKIDIREYVEYSSDRDLGVSIMGPSDVKTLSSLDIDDGSSEIVLSRNEEVVDDSEDRGTDEAMMGSTVSDVSCHNYMEDISEMSGPSVHGDSECAPASEVTLDSVLATNQDTSTQSVQMIDHNLQDCHHQF